MISNRMVAGPNANLSGNQAGAMGESWSDLAAAEFLNSQALVPVSDENPFAVGPYVTGDKVAGIRNYGMNASPLNLGRGLRLRLQPGRHLHAAHAGAR